MKNKKLILSLIKDDLINSKLVNSLNEIGLSADKYFLNLKDTVLNLMGFKEDVASDKIFERYMELSKQAVLIDISESHKTLDALVMEIYRELLTQKLSSKYLSEHRQGWVK